MKSSLELPDLLREKILQIRALSTFCYSCGKCLSECPTSLLGTFSPKDFLHKIVNQGEQTLVDFIPQLDLFSCLTCEKCMKYCPMQEEDSFLFAEIVRLFREVAFENSLLFNELVATQTHDGIMTINPIIQSRETTLCNNCDYIKKDKDLKTQNTGEIALFIGCNSLMEDLFEKLDPQYKDSARAAVFLLNECGINPVIAKTKCCGHDAFWTGDTNTAKSLAQYNVDLYKNAGVKTILVQCAEGYRMWKYDYPKLVDGFDFTVKHLSEYLMDADRNRIQPKNTLPKVKITYHDPCRLGRLGGIYEEPRKILRNLNNVELVEMENNREDANCCGVSVFRTCNAKTKILRMKRIEEAIKTGAEYLITTCPKCITHFKCLQNEYNEKEGELMHNISKLKVMDLSQFVAKRDIFP
ncbi:MAG: 4Fe-4S dicluster domain-containing protein [Candidatus Lokiarchaeota archaeon]|nr:4Fe-4S dicluster domain-containing protein [Candidatus Lokiarchaeota archaeon]